MTEPGGPPVPWTHEFAIVHGLRLHYVRQGAGVPVVLLHGWPGFWYEWAPVMPALAAHHEVIVPDLQGFGLMMREAPEVVIREVLEFLAPLR